MEIENKFLSNSALKIIAIIIMFIDHFAASNAYSALAIKHILFPDYSFSTWLDFRIIGRIAFPIFAFLIVEGFFYTRNVWKYALRLGLFALISEIPFDLAFNQGSPYSLIQINHLVILEYASQNVFFTLLFGLLAILFYDKFRKNPNKSYYFLGFLTSFVLAYVFRTDYSFYGVILIYLFYLARGNFPRVIMSLIIFDIILFGLIDNNWIESFSLLALFFIYFYNYKKGVSIKYLFYGFYPIHLLLLFLIRFYVG